MKFETSTRISAQEVQENEKRLREAATQVGHPKFFGPNDKLEIVNNPSSPSVEELAENAKGRVTPKGDPTLCWLAYQAALQLCGGNAVCQAIAAAAYDACLRS